LRSCWAWLPVDWVEFAAALEVAAEGAPEDERLAAGGVVPPPRNENTCPSTEVKPGADDERLVPELPPPLELELELVAAGDELADAARAVLVEEPAALLSDASRAAGVVDGSLQAVVLGLA
jgi:hypothetical protein